MGASLGANSIASGKKAALLGLLLVVIFMFVAYGLFGLFANIAASPQHRDDLRRAVADGRDPDASGHRRHRARPSASRSTPTCSSTSASARRYSSGKSPFAAVDAGYTRALTTIINSNVTTLISVLVLFWLGIGPGARVRRDADHRHHRLDVHRRHRYAADGVLLAALGAAATPSRSRKYDHMFTGIHFIPPDTKIDFVRLRTITWVDLGPLTVVPLLLVGARAQLRHRLPGRHAHRGSRPRRAPPISPIFAARCTASVSARCRFRNLARRTPC